MRIVNVILEGDKDVFFMHEFILQRFPAFSREPNVLPHRLKRNPIVLKPDDGSVEIRLHRVGGCKNLQPHADLLKKPPAFDDEFRSVVVFDADNASTGGGVPCRRRDLIGQVEESGRDVILEPDQIFLLPDNESDGDLEVLMERIASDTDEHRAFFSTCWDGYRLCVQKHGFNRVSQKSKMNEYAAAFNSHVWDDGGVNMSIQDANLWNWKSAALNSLESFMKKFMYE